MTVKRYKQKWVDVEVIKYEEGNRSEVFDFLGEEEYDQRALDWLTSPPIYFHRQSGVENKASVGDYIVKDIPSGDCLVWVSQILDDFEFKYVEIGNV